MTTRKFAPAVEEAVDEIRKAFPRHSVVAEPDDDGGAFVTVSDLFLGDQYEPAASWIGFHITFQYPHADIYPHNTTAALKRRNGQPLGEGFHTGKEWKTPSRTEPATMMSRKSKDFNAARDTAAVKLRKILDWTGST